MKMVQFALELGGQLSSTSKISRPKVSSDDFVRLIKLAEAINACDKRAEKINIEGETFFFDDLKWPVCLKELIYPCALTVTGKIDGEADWLTHTFGSIIENTDEKKVVKKEQTVEKDGKETTQVVDVEEDYKPFDGYELDRFNYALYGSWKQDPEVISVKDCRAAASMSADMIAKACSASEVATGETYYFPISTKIDLFSDEHATDTVDRRIKMWIITNVKPKGKQ